MHRRSYAERSRQGNADDESPYGGSRRPRVMTTEVPASDKYMAVADSAAEARGRLERVERNAGPFGGVVSPFIEITYHYEEKARQLAEVARQEEAAKKAQQERDDYRGRHGNDWRGIDRARDIERGERNTRTA